MHKRYNGKGINRYGLHKISNFEIEIGISRYTYNGVIFHHIPSFPFQRYKLTKVTLSNLNTIVPYINEVMNFYYLDSIEEKI